MPVERTKKLRTVGIREIHILSANYNTSSIDIRLDDVSAYAHDAPIQRMVRKRQHPPPGFCSDRLQRFGEPCCLRIRYIARRRFVRRQAFRGVQADHAQLFALEVSVAVSCDSRAISGSLAIFPDKLEKLRIWYRRPVLRDGIRSRVVIAYRPKLWYPLKRFVNVRVDLRNMLLCLRNRRCAGSPSVVAEIAAEIDSRQNVGQCLHRLRRVQVSGHDIRAAVLLMRVRCRNKHNAVRCSDRVHILRHGQRLNLDVIRDICVLDGIGGRYIHLQGFSAQRQRFPILIKCF